MKKLIDRSNKENLIAVLTETKPEAIILNFLVGCFLSLSLSIESLIKYIAEEIKQNAIKAWNESNQFFFSKVKAKSGARNTNRFLIHWFGLVAKNKFLIF